GSDRAGAAQGLRAGPDPWMVRLGGVWARDRGCDRRRPAGRPRGAATLGRRDTRALPCLREDRRGMLGFGGPADLERTGPSQRVGGAGAGGLGIMSHIPARPNRSSVITTA